MQIFYRKKAVTSDTCQALPNGQSLIKVKTRHKKPSVPHGWNGCIHRVMNLYSHRGKNIPPALKRQHWELLCTLEYAVSHITGSSSQYGRQELCCSKSTINEVSGVLFLL